MEEVPSGRICDPGKTQIPSQTWGSREEALASLLSLSGSLQVFPIGQT